MKKNFLLLIILVIFLLSWLSFYMILNYIDPFANTKMAVFFLLIIFFSMLSSFLSIFIYFIKKIHFRWDVTIYNLTNSFRQASFITLFIIWVIIFDIFKAPMFLSTILLFILFLFLELFISSLKS